jgi:acetyl-CoA synthetase
MKSLYGNINLKNLKLKILGSMGEPLANSVGRWFVKNFGVKNMPIINTYFQTETGGIITSHKFNQKIEQKFYGYVGEPIKSHIKLNYLSNKKKEIKILNSWPGQMINVINSKKHWNEYFDELKNFRMFDYATKKGDNIFIHGRTDDVINIRGHRIGSSEIEAVVLELNSIIECSAICVDDDIEGNIFYLFCKSLTKKISDIEVKIIKNFGTYAIPRKIYFVDEIPKTRSGKIMRRVLRDLVKNPRKAIKSDISTLVNKNILKSISNVIKNT